MSCTYVVCAAGRGTRTAAINPSVAKPLLKVEGKSFLERSVESLPLQKQDSLIIVCQRNDKIPQSARLPEALQSQTQFLELNEYTRGQLETAYLTKTICDERNAICIFNADTYFRSNGLLTKLSNSAYDGVIPCSREVGDSWSFCKTEHENDSSKIIKVTEKERIADWCSVGFYHFRNASDFFTLASEALTQADRVGTAKEIYVAPLYNRFIESGANIVLDIVNEFRPMGSIDQLARYWSKTLKQLQSENPMS